MRRHGAETVRVRRALLAVVAGVMAAAAPGLGAQVRVVSGPGRQVSGAQSAGVFANEFLYVSGQGSGAAHRQPAADLEGQVRQALGHLQTIVEAGGLTLAHVVYSQVHLTDMAHYDTMDRVWREFFPTAPPARAVIGVHRLPEGRAVDVTAVAYRDLAGRRPIVPAGASPTASASPGVMAGHRLYLSGAFGVDPRTGRVPADPDAQVRLALDTLERTLAAAGLDARHLVFVNPYLTSGASRRMNAIYAERFEFGNTPARATITVASLPGANTIQFTGVAITDLARRRAYRPQNMRPSPTASPCVLADDTYFCSAKGPFTPGPADGPARLQGIWVGTIEAQVRQTMRNLLDGLEEAGLGLADVVATHVYLDDMNDFAALDRIYGEYFPEAPPARTTVAPVAPTDRTVRAGGTFPGLEQISLIAVKARRSSDAAR